MPMMQPTPTRSVTGWVLLTFIATVVIVGGPLLNMLGLLGVPLGSKTKKM